MWWVGQDVPGGKSLLPAELPCGKSLHAGHDCEEAAGERLPFQRRLVEIDRRRGDVEAVEVGSPEGAVGHLRDRHLDAAVDLARRREAEIGRASCRARVCKYV